MAHPYKSAGHKNDPKWLGRLGRERGGRLSETRGMKFDDLRANAMYPTGDQSGTTTNSAGPNRMSEVIPSPSPFGQNGRRVDTNIDVDTDFGQGHDVKTMSDRLGDDSLVGRKRGGRVKKRADGGDASDDSQTMSPQPAPGTQQGLMSGPVQGRAPTDDDLASQRSALRGVSQFGPTGRGSIDANGRVHGMRKGGRAKK